MFELAGSVSATSREILDFWFGTLDDDTPLDRAQEPFRRFFMRWYGKLPAVDREVRDRFEPALLAVTRSDDTWRRAEEDFAVEPLGLLALLVLVDQMPRNMYRGTREMYRFDERGHELCRRVLDSYESWEVAPKLVQRLFCYVPLLHVEELAAQERAVQLFERLRLDSQDRSEPTRAFFSMAKDSAERHLDAIERFGRFPHRNEILGRPTRPEELVYLLGGEGNF